MVLAARGAPPRSARCRGPSRAAARGRAAPAAPARGRCSRCRRGYRRGGGRRRAPARSRSSRARRARRAPARAPRPSDGPVCRSTSPACVRQAAADCVTPRMVPACASLAYAVAVLGEELTMIAYCDLAGLVRGRSVPAATFEDRLRAGVGWVPANQAICCFGPLAEPNPWGSVGDRRLIPDPATRVRVDLWDDATPLDFVLSDATHTDGSPWDACPRTFLRPGAGRPPRGDRAAPGGHLRARVRARRRCRRRAVHARRPARGGAVRRAGRGGAPRRVGASRR